MSDQLNALGEQLFDLIRTNAEEFGVELKDSASEIATYASQQASMLSAAAAEPGFADALETARDNVVMFATSEAIDRADSVDARFLSVVQGALAIAATAINVVL